MRQPTTAEISRINASVAQTMFDSGKIGTYVGVSDALHSVQPSWTLGSEIKCGFSWRGGAKFYKGQYVIETEKAVVRLPMGTTVTKSDHFTLTKKNGVNITPTLSFGIESMNFGIGEIICQLKAIEV